MATVQQVPRLVEIAYYEQPHEGYEPTAEDWEDYRRQLEREEAMERLDRVEVMEAIRRDQFNSARSAVCQVRGVAASLQARGLEPMAARLLRAAQDMMDVIHQYA